MNLKPKILYVDDEVENLLVFRQTFKHDFDVVTADSPQKALLLLDSQTFEIILTDQRMPEMTGVQMLEEVQLKSVDSVRILMTGFSDMDAIVNAINQGRIFYYCTKPWNREALQLIFLKAFEYIDLNRRNKRLIHDLSKTLKELETFLYRASHNLKTPITSQLGLLSLLKVELNESQSLLIGHIEQSVVDLQKTISKMETLSSFGYSFLKEEYVMQVKSVFTQILAKQKARIDEKKSVVNLEMDDTLEFMTYTPYISMMLEIILENAITYSSPDRSPHEVGVFASASENGELRVTIRDNGIGISPEILPHVFDAFYRGNAQSQGSGLGLYVCRKICDTLKIRIQILSDGKSGTTVEMIVPNLIPQT